MGLVVIVSFGQVFYGRRCGDGGVHYSHGRLVVAVARVVRNLGR